MVTQVFCSFVQILIVVLDSIPFHIKNKFSRRNKNTSSFIIYKLSLFAMRRWLWLLVMVSVPVTVFSMDDQHRRGRGPAPEEFPETKAETKSSINQPDSSSSPQNQLRHHFDSHTHISHTHLNKYICKVRIFGSLLLFLCFSF